jgi:hypothetical protein
MVRTARRISYIFLCTLPFLALVVAGVHTLRIPGVYQAVGAVLFAVILIAAWILGARVIASAVAAKRRMALAGFLLIAPWAVIALLWVGLQRSGVRGGRFDSRRYGGIAASLEKAGWIGRGAARAYVIANVILLVLVVMRGLSFPELSNNTAPWYTRPGFIAGIPAIPWMMPCLLGVVLLRRAGNETIAA